MLKFGYREPTTGKGKCLLRHEYIGNAGPYNENLEICVDNMECSVE